MNNEELDKKWNIHKVMKEAIEKAHIEPAPETRERLSCLEISQKNLMDKLNEFQSDNKEAHEQIRKDNSNGIAQVIQALNILEAKLDEALDKKAGIWVENVLIATGSAIGLALLTYIGTLIYETTVHLVKWYNKLMKQRVVIDDKGNCHLETVNDEGTFLTSEPITSEQAAEWTASNRF